MTIHHGSSSSSYNNNPNHNKAVEPLRDLLGEVLQRLEVLEHKVGIVATITTGTTTTTTVQHHPLLSSGSSHNTKGTVGRNILLFFYIYIFFDTQKLKFADIFSAFGNLSTGIFLHHSTKHNTTFCNYNSQHNSIIE
jgi:hypothetical protein